MRTHLLNNVLNMAGMKFDYDDKSKELRESRITSRHRTAIGSMMNPFDSSVPESRLFNIMET